MMLRLLCSSLLLLLALKNMAVSAASCSACGAGFEISLPDVVVTTNNGTFTCSEIQTAAASGAIPESQCAFIPVFIFTDCGCVNSTGVSTTPAPVASSPTKAPVAPTKKPVAPTKKPTTTAPVAAPTSSSSAPGAASTTCAICADGETISNLDVEVTVPNTGTFTCSQIDSFAAAGAVPASQCSLLVELRTTCGCTGGSGSGNTTATTAPVAAPKTSAPSVAATTTAPVPSSSSPTTAPPAAATPTAPTSSSSACAICPSGQSITKPDVSVDVPNTGTFTCSQIDAFATSGAIPASQCSLLPQLATTCGCSGGSTPTAPSKPSSPSKPTSPVAPSPVASSKAPVTAAPAAATPTAATPTPATPTAPTSGSSACAICSSGQTITKPDVSVDVPNTGTFTCSQIDGFASSGAIPASQCSLLSQLATTCGCSGGSTPTAPSKPSSPVAPIAPSSTPVAAGPTAPTCSICTSSQVLSKPDVVVSVPNTGSFSCSQIQSFADGGSVPASQCPLLPQLATQCGCVAASPSSPSTPTAAKPTAPSPVTSESPTLAGTYPPTPEVTYKPSRTSAATATTWSTFGMMLTTAGAVLSLLSVAV